MIKHNKNTVTISNDEWDELIEELSSLRNSYNDANHERSLMVHFIRYNNLQKLYEEFKASPPDDDPDDIPFDSYRN